MRPVLNLNIVTCSRLVLLLLVLFVLQVAHKASTRARQRCRSAETRSRRPYVQPFSFISLSTVLLQVSLGRPLFLWPSGVHRRAILVKAEVCWRSTCPIHRQRLRLAWVEMGPVWYSSYSSHTRLGCLSPSRKQLSSSDPQGCHRACPSVVSVLATCPTSEHHVVGSDALDVLQA